MIRVPPPVARWRDRCPGWPEAVQGALNHPRLPREPFMRRQHVGVAGRPFFRDVDVMAQKDMPHRRASGPAGGQPMNRATEKNGRTGRGRKGDELDLMSGRRLFLPLFVRGHQLKNQYLEAGQTSRCIRGSAAEVTLNLGRLRSLTHPPTSPLIYPSIAPAHCLGTLW